MRSDDEKRILGLWPKYEDGSYVRLGDSYIDTDGDENEVMAIEFNDRCADLIGVEGCHTGFEPFERVKRPAPKVLDADGVEIKVGDTVWHHSGFAHGVVTSIDAGSLMSTVRYFNGYAEFRDAAKDLTHTRPDSWERLEEDIAKHPCLYAEEVKGSKLDSCSECPWHSDVIARDIIRRAKALAEKEAEK